MSPPYTYSYYYGEENCAYLTEGYVYPDAYNTGNSASRSTYGACAEYCDYKAAPYFSWATANSDGACPTCNGAGVIYTDLAMMAGVASTCEDCEGRRFQAAVLELTFGGRNIAEVLAMPVAEAADFFGGGVPLARP